MNTHPLLDRIPTLPRPRPRAWMRFGVFLVAFLGGSLLCLATSLVLAIVPFAGLFAFLLLAILSLNTLTSLTVPVNIWTLFGVCLVLALLPMLRSVYVYLKYAWQEARPDEAEDFRPYDDPFLTELVLRLSKKLGVPAPAAIYPTTRHSAYAFRRSEDKRFAIALAPYVLSCVRSRDLACVLTHEIAHFPEIVWFRYRLLWHLQTYLNWAPEAYLGADPNSLGCQYGRPFANFKRWVDRLVRLPGNSLFKLQLLLCAWFWRFHQNEADRLAVELIGKRAAGSAMRKLYSVGVADTELELVLCEYFNAGWRVVDIGNLCARYLEQIVPDGPFAQLSHLFALRTDWNNTSPCQLERLHLARRGPEVDLPTSDRPVSEFVADFAAIDEAASSAFYRKHDMKGFEKHPICESEALVKDVVHRERAKAAFERFLPDASVYLDSWMDSLEAWFPFDESDADESDTTARIVAARRIIEEQAESWQEQFGRFKAAKRALQGKTMSKWLSDARADFLELVPIDDTRHTLGKIPDGPGHPREAMATAEKEMQPYVDAAVERLRCAMLLLGQSEFRKQLSGGEGLYSRCLKAQPTLRALARLRPAMTTLDWIGLPLCMGYGSTKWNGWQRREEQRLPEGIMPVLELIRTAFETIQEIGREVPCPHLDGAGTVTLFEYVAAPPRIGMEDGEDAAVSKEPPPEGSAEALFDELVLNLDIPLAVTGRYGDVVASTFGELALAAEAVETALGLPPLEPWDPS